MNPYSIIQSFGEKGTGKGQFCSPAGICVNNKEIFVADEFNHRIQKFSADGNFILSFGSYGKNNSQFYYPTSIICDKEDNILITDRWNHRVQKFSPTGDFILSFGVYGSQKGAFSEPYGITISEKNYLFVSDCNNHRITEFDQKGTFIKSFGMGGPSQTFYESPEFKDNFIFKKWITQSNKFNSIENIFRKNKYKLGTLDYPKNIFFAKDTLWVCDSGNNRIINFSLNGDLLTSFGPLEKNICSFKKPVASLIIDNFLFVVSDTASCLYKINLTTNDEQIFELGDIRCISLAAQDASTLLIGDCKNHKIHFIKI